MYLGMSMFNNVLKCMHVFCILQEVGVEFEVSI